MSTIYKFLLLFSIGLGILFQRCKTEIDVIAPKRDVTIIYGLLEANKTRHFIRINKSFVGETSAAELAAINGINEYAPSEISARIVELNSDSTETGNKWDLLRTTITNKAQGDFNSDSNVIYYFDATLNANRIYKIECDVNVAEEDPKLVTATTNLVGNQSSIGIGIEQVRLVNPNLSGSNSTNGGTDRTADEVSLVNRGLKYTEEFSSTWTSVAGGHRYSSFLRFYYTELSRSTGMVIKKDSVSLGFASRTLDNAQGEVRFPSKSAEEFYSRIGSLVEDVDVAGDIERVVSDTLQFFLEIANEELTTFIEVNQPISDVAQERPEYTNVKNGLGIFASRLVVSTRTDVPQTNGRIMDAPSLEELLYANIQETGNHTGNKNFTLPRRCTTGATGQNCD